MIEWCNANQGFVMTLLTGVYVFATIILVYMAYKANTISEQNTRSLAKLEQERMRPLIEVRIESEPPFLILRVINQGQTPAYGIRIETTPHIMALRGGKGVYPQEKTQEPIGFIENETGALGAGCSVSTIMGSFSRVTEVYPEMRFVGSVKFRSFESGEYTSPIDLDLRYMKNALHVGRKTMHDVARELEGIRNEIRLLGNGFHKPHVLVQSVESRRAEEAAFGEAVRAQVDKQAVNDVQSQPSEATEQTPLPVQKANE